MDSVTYRIHTPKTNGKYDVHGELARALTVNSYANRSMMNQKVEWTSYSTRHWANGLAVMEMDYLLDHIHYEDNDKKIKMVKGSFNVPSSHYHVGYRVNEEREFIDISFSLPKYVYGHSVAQLVSNPHPSATRFKGTYATFDTVVKDWWNIFIKLTRDFFHYTFSGYEIDFNYVEVLRLDFAFNQYFESKELCYQVANMMSNKRMSTIRGKKGKKGYYTDSVQDYSTGFVSLHRNMYYKIYHKGSEFEKNDAKVLTRKNEEVMKKYHQYIKDYGEDNAKAFLSNQRMFDVTALKNEADLILRHEIRFFSKDMSYHFKRHLYNKGDKEWQKDFKRWKKLDLKRTNYSKSGLDKYRLTDEENKFYKKIGRIVDKRHNFMLKKSGNGLQRSLNDGMLTEQLFSKELFYFMVDKFYKIIGDAQIKERPMEDAISERIDEHNEFAKTWNKNLPKTKIMGGVELKKAQIIPKINLLKELDRCEKYGGLDMAYEKGKIAKATYYKYRKCLEKIGYGSTMSPIPIKTTTDFSTYFERIQGIGLGKRLYFKYFSGMELKYKEYC